MILINGYWIFNITIPSDSINDLYYIVSAEDNYGFIAQTSIKDITIIDSLSPVIIDHTDPISGTGNTFLFNATVTDNIEVSTVIANYWYGIDPEQHVILTFDGSTYQASITTPSQSTTPMQYNITATDTSINTQNTTTKTVTIYDATSSSNRRIGKYYCNCH